MNSSIKIGLLCGGPSLERGISLNSARSALDHLQASDISIFPFYFDLNRQAYELSPAHLYSNTPSDFDFKVAQIGKLLPDLALRERLRQMDLIFPAIHGAFGEDGGIQAFLEEIRAPFVGSSSATCRQAFDKYNANRQLAENGFFTLPNLLLEPTMADIPGKIELFFQRRGLNRAIVKPTKAGSSVGVHVIQSPEEGAAAFTEICRQDIDNQAVVEPFCQGQEFTLILIQNDQDEPVALLPTEIGLETPGQQIFDYRKKYLPTQQVTYHVPPRFSDETIREIQRQGERIFKLFGMRDWARFDGWVLPDGNIWFSDLNMVSGMEQNSFMFIQGAQAGFSHAGLLRHILRQACRRIAIQLPAIPPQSVQTSRKQPVQVIFGGDSSERQVSLMSGANVWLKLLRSQKYAPQPFLLDRSGEVWRLPYSLILRHTVEEVSGACRQAMAHADKLRRFREEILQRLHPHPQLAAETEFNPHRLSLDQFIAEAELVFIAIHGGIGENGDLQAMLDQAKVPYSGSGAAASRLCMDKHKTGEALRELADAGIRSAPKILVAAENLNSYTSSQFQHSWQEMQRQLGSPSLIVKPSGDGCSSGVARLFGAADWERYAEFMLEGVPRIPPDSLSRQPAIIEMPTEMPTHLLLERFVATDEIRIEAGELVWEEKTGWVEMTVGVLGKTGQLRALTPSITISASSVLSLEEKFQGGTGVNITPPPAEFVPASSVARARQLVEKAANKLGISGFARIDIFMEVKTGAIIVIEANTIPGLTPSTVIYHQALAESPPLFPTQFLERILDFRAISAAENQIQI